jgi:hypothetical protein
VSLYIAGFGRPDWSLAEKVEEKSEKVDNLKKYEENKGNTSETNENQDAPKVETVVDTGKHIVVEDNKTQANAVETTNENEASTTAEDVSTIPEDLRLSDKKLEAAKTFYENQNYSTELILKIQHLVGANETGSINDATIHKIGIWQKQYGLTKDGQFGNNSLKKAGLVKNLDFLAIMQDAYNNEIFEKEAADGHLYFDFNDVPKCAVVNFGSGSNFKARPALADAIKDDDGKIRLHVNSADSKDVLVYDSAEDADLAIKKAFGYNSHDEWTAILDKEGWATGSANGLSMTDLKTKMGLDGSKTLTDSDGNSYSITFDDKNYLNLYVNKDTCKRVAMANTGIDVQYKEKVQNAVAETLNGKSNLITQALVHWGHGAPAILDKMSNFLITNIDLFKDQLTQGYWDEEMIDLIEEEFTSNDSRAVVFHYLYLKEDLGSSGIAIHTKGYPDARPDKSWYEKRRACRKAAIANRYHNILDSDFD